VKERPIIFSAESVRAILAGRKTQTRRLVRLPEGVNNVRGFVDRVKWGGYDGAGPHGIIMCPHAIGDLLWVRETWAHVSGNNGNPAYRADGESETARWKSSMFMPRWASRIDLEITDVRVQRLYGISEDDARAEGFETWMDGPWWACMRKDGSAFDVGVEPDDEMRRDLVAVVESPRSTVATARKMFARAWDAINGKRATWASNPWVWAITFSRVKP
jgi:hypothetical protein